MWTVFYTYHVPQFTVAMFQVLSCYYCKSLMFLVQFCESHTLTIGVYCWSVSCLSESVGAATTKHQNWEDYKQQEFIPQTSGGRCLRSGFEGPSSPQTSPRILTGREGRGTLWGLFYKSVNPIHEGSPSWPIAPPKASPPDTNTWDFRVSTYKSGGTQTF